MEQKEPKIDVAIIGATGTVGKQYVSLLVNHPWFHITGLAASKNSAGKSYSEALRERGTESAAIPEHIAAMTVEDAVEDIDAVADKCALVFSAVDMDKENVRRLEVSYARAGAAVVSNNSAHRWTPDVPLIMPEINPQHTDIIPLQRKNRGWTKGLIAVKPNCSIQSYVPVLEAMKKFKPGKAVVSTYQAVSGAGRTLADWPEMHDNVIPYIPGEEDKSEKEPLKIWGSIRGNLIEPASGPSISSTCVRVPVSDGHLTVVHVALDKKAGLDELRECIVHFHNPVSSYHLPSSPRRFMTYFEDPDRPQTRIDRDLEGGMGIAVGRLRRDTVLDWKFVSLSHNTLRGAAGGAILLAELLVHKNYIQ